MPRLGPYTPAGLRGPDRCTGGQARGRAGAQKGRRTAAVAVVRLPVPAAQAYTRGPSSVWRPAASAAEAASSHWRAVSRACRTSLVPVDTHSV